MKAMEIRAVSSVAIPATSKLNPVRELVIPLPVQKAMAYLAILGRCYLSGGVVRDLLMSRQPKDYDLISDASVEMITGIPGAKVMTNVTNTIFVHVDGIEIEITPLQNKGKHGIIDDLMDRDLTINSMAIQVSVKNGQIVLGTLLDPTGRGVGDVKQGIVHFSDTAEITPERLIRTCRFASTLNFTASRETIDKLRAHSGSIGRAPVEKVQTEFMKILESDNPSAGLSLMIETGILDHMLKFAKSPAEVSTQNLNLERTVQASQDVRLVILLKELRYTSKNFNGFLKKYCFSNEEIQRSQKLLEALESVDKLQSNAEIREVLAKLAGNKEKDQYLEGFISLLKAYSVLSNELEVRIRKASQATLTIRELAVNGEDLKQMGLSGPGIGNALKRLLALVIADPDLNSKEVLLSKIKEGK
jgi:tRNA nucleotidyltransferase/poly(A) polymerase